MIVSSSAGSIYCSLNYGSLYLVSMSSLNMLWIAHPSGSSSWNIPKLMFFEILKGPYPFWSSFFEGQFDWIFLFSNHILSLTFNPWEFCLFLSNCLFIFFCASSINYISCSQLFYSSVINSSTLGNSDYTTRSSFYRYLPKFNSNNVLPIAACLLTLYWNSAAANHPVQLFCW